MALTPGGTPYVESSDLVANYPASSLALANKVDTKLDNAPTDNAQSGLTYTFVLADARQLVSATNASAKTFTIPPQASVTWVAGSMIRVVNYGAGALTVDGGVGVTVTNTAATLAQYQAATAIRTGTNAWTLVPFAGGASNANFSNAATGTYSVGPINYKYIQFNSSGSLVVTTAGYADVWIMSGGAGDFNGVWNGGAGGLNRGARFFTATTHTVTIGAGGPASSGVGGGITTVGPYTCTRSGLWIGLGNTNVTDGTGLSDSITGSSVLYGRGGTTPVANRGEGGGVGFAGSSGVAIIRVVV